MYFYVIWELENTHNIARDIGWSFLLMCLCSNSWQMGAVVTYYVMGVGLVSIVWKGLETIDLKKGKKFRMLVNMI